MSEKNGPKRTKESAFSAELQQALAMLEDLIKSCELAVDLAAVTGCPDLLDFESPEDLEMDPRDLEGSSVKNGPKRTKESAFSAELQQALAMLEDLIKSCELAVDLAAVTGCPLMTLSIRQLGRRSNRKFEIAHQNGLEKYILQAASKEIRDCWFSEISKLLMEQQNNIKDVHEDEENGRQISPKCCSSREFISMETFDDCEGAEDMEKESSALSGHKLN